MILEKVRRYYPSKSEEELETISFSLTNQAELLKNFQHLLNLKYVGQVVVDLSQDTSDSQSQCDLVERETAHKQMEQVVARICHLPIKLCLSKVQRYTPPLAHTFSSLLRYEFGPLHASLQVGDVSIEWESENLVVPSYTSPKETLFVAHVHDQGEWFEESRQLVKEMCLADRSGNRKRKIEILNDALQRKDRLLKKLANVIVDYNLNKKYNFYSCSGHHFVLDCLAVLGIKSPPKFSGQLNEHYQKLKRGKACIAKEIQTHKQLDMHVSKELSDVSLTLLDAEYLLCQYFQFHLASTEAVKDEVKRCSLPNCQRDTLEKWIKEHSVLLDHFLEEACTNHDQPTCTAVASIVPGEVADDRVEQLKAAEQAPQQVNDLLRETLGERRDHANSSLVIPNFYDAEVDESAESSTLRKTIQVLWRKVREAKTRAELAEAATLKAETTIHELRQSLEVAERRAVDVEERASTQIQDTTYQVQELEAKVQMFESQWVIQKGEIELTEEELGKGGWAVVKVATFRGLRVAAKCFYRQIVSEYNQRLFTREMDMAARIRHPNLVQFVGATLEGAPIILTELMSTSLRAVLERGPISHAQVVSISLDIARALNYLHLMKPDPIIHRDISSANVLLNPLPDNCWKAKISDYGSVNLLRQLQTVGPGSPVYAAPEAGIPASQSPKMDIFSFGILLIEMITDKFPEVAERRNLIRLIEHPGLLELVQRCIDKENGNRPCAANIIRELSDRN